MTEIEEDINKCRDSLCSWIKRTCIVKMFSISKAIYRFNSISIKNPMAFSEGKKKANCVWNHKRPQIAKVILRTNNKAAGIMLI